VANSLHQLQRQIESCTRCARLNTYRAEIAVTKRKAYAQCDYWAKPVAGFGDPAAKIWILGLAPGAHGANRTGRVFTGDRSGDFLFAALHRCGFSNQPTSISMNDGLKLNGVFISATARCAPPGNKPLPAEIKNCEPFLDREWKLLKNKRVILALGAIAWDAAVAMGLRNGALVTPALRYVVEPGLATFDPALRRTSEPASQSSRQKFSHGAEMLLTPGLTLIGSYHVSQQNTFTGRLTIEMFDQILMRCASAYSAPGSSPPNCISTT
jgi:uracil-DNA glycosylase family 4